MYTSPYVVPLSTILMNANPQSAAEMFGESETSVASEFCEVYLWIPFIHKVFSKKYSFLLEIESACVEYSMLVYSS